MNTSGLQIVIFCGICLAFFMLIYYNTNLNQGRRLPLFKPKMNKVAESYMKPPKKDCKKPLNSTTTYPFEGILLAINFNHPYYSNIGIMNAYYRHLFPRIVMCGPEAEPSGRHKIIVVEQPKEYGYYGFQCLVEAIRHNPGYAGYLYVNDDVIFNWWNLYNLDRTKIWFPMTGIRKRDMVLPPKTFFWQRAATLDRCINTYKNMESDPKFINMKAIQMYMDNVGYKRVCVSSLSDIVYIPGRLAEKYKIIGQKFYDRRLFLEVSTPMALLMIEKEADIISLQGVYLQEKYNNWGPWTGKTARAWKDYNYNIHFLHPYKFSGENQTKNTNEFVDRVLRTSEAILNSSCLDYLNVGRFWAKD